MERVLALKWPQRTLLQSKYRKKWNNWKEKVAEKERERYIEKVRDKKIKIMIIERERERERK